VNAAGGITVGNTTYQVQIKYYDDGSSPAKSAQLTQRLVEQDKVNFLLGPYGSAATIQDAPVANQHHIPMVEANGAAKAIFTSDNHYVFGVLSPTAEYARTMINAALALLNPPQTIAIIYASDAFSKEVAVSARDYAKQQGLNVVFFQQYPSSADGVTQMLSQLKTSANGAAPDFILGSGHGDEAIATMKDCKALGVNAKLFGFTVGPALPEFISTLGGDANDVVGSSQWTPQENYHGIDSFGTPANYTQLYEAAYHQAPSYQAAESTAAGLAFQYAIQNANSVNPARVRDALSTLDIMTFYGRLKFDSTGANVYKPMATIQIQYGHVVTVYPPDVSNAQLTYPTPPFGSR
jgi:branched-chain amino acid transport system substrate-binding protein